MSSRKAFTLVETIVVIAIIIVLASLAFVAGAPSREKARQIECMAHLRQMHMAVTMYSSDSDAGEEIPGIPSLSYVARRGIRVLDPYIKSEAVKFCPDFPSRARVRVATSYVWFPFWREMDPSLSGGEIQLIAWTQDRIQKLGNMFPMWVCKTHDEVYYQPRESHIARELSQPFVVEIALDGSIHSGRRPYLRGNFLNAYLGGK